MLVGRRFSGGATCPTSSLVNDPLTLIPEVLSSSLIRTAFLFRPLAGGSERSPLTVLIAARSRAALVIGEPLLATYVENEFNPKPRLSSFYYIENRHDTQKKLG